MVATALQPKPGSGQPSSLPQAPLPLRFEAPGNEDYPARARSRRHKTCREQGKLQGNWSWE
ncbi:hypothetical protein [Oryza sativa Japonica Group]|uniref:Uncharacterized protein P0501G01.23 n=1 Tax=Oryza sativa subsp. japonica TaxID=39947 RepID=Q5ZE65_ORYSJ|nr:hypothetical protein [Oryza sativa Japonica Group]